MSAAAIDLRILLRLVFRVIDLCRFVCGHFGVNIRLCLAQQLIDIATLACDRLMNGTK